MGLIQKIKELFSARRYINDVLEQQEQTNQKYLSMTASELAQLPQEELVTAVRVRIDCHIKELKEKAGYLSVTGLCRQLSEPMKAVFAVSVFVGFLDAGEGLETFLTEEENSLLPLLPEALSEVGATDLSSLLETFLSTYEVDPISVSENDVKRIECLHGTKPFEDFFEAYRALPSTDGILASYIHRHIDCF